MDVHLLEGEWVTEKINYHGDSWGSLAMNHDCRKMVFMRGMRVEFYSYYNGNWNKQLNHEKLIVNKNGIFVTGLKNSLSTITNLTPTSLTFTFFSGIVCYYTRVS